MLRPYSKILVVDDSAITRKIIRRLLKELGYHYIREATDGIDALQKLSAVSFDLVLSDWDMAPMDGVTLLSQMRRTPKFRAIPFVMVTAFAGRKYQDLARDNGATFYMVKPIFAQDLSERIAQIAAGRIAA